MVKGKLKGNNYERKISKILSLWISEGTYDDLFWRTQGSGGRHTRRYKNNLTLEGQAGDVASTRSGISEKFLKKICVEIKFYKDINIWALITKSKDGILDFWNQTNRKAMDVNKIPVLIVKENYKPALFVSNNNNLYNIFINTFKINPDIEVLVCDEKLFIWKLDDILNINPKQFMSKINRIRRG
jgi:hypothetical protein